MVGKRKRKRERGIYVVRRVEEGKGQAYLEEGKNCRKVEERRKQQYKRDTEVRIF